MFFYDFKQAFAYQAAEDLCANVHEVHPSPLVRIREFTTLGNRYNLASVPLFKVSGVFPEFSNELEVIPEAGGIHCFESIGGYTVQAR